jgi:hypothetical protein
VREWLFDDSPGERREWKAAILEGLENAGSDRKAYEPAFIQAFGPGPGVLMSQLFFWTGNGMDPAGWIYKTEREWKWETGLSRDQQREARKILKAKDVLQEDKKGVPCKLYFRIKLERLAEAMLETLNQRYTQTPKACQTSEEPRGCRTCQTPEGHLSGWEAEWCHTGEESKGCLACRAPLLLQRVLTQSTSEVTSESTSDLTSKDSALQAARNDHFVPLPEEQINLLKEELADHSPTYPANGDDQLAGKVRLVLEQGRHAPVALKHYRARCIGSDEVAQYVSYDLTGNTDRAERLTPIVERVVAELETVEATTS